MGVILGDNLNKKDKTKPDVEVVKEKNVVGDIPKTTETTSIDEKELFKKQENERIRNKEMKKDKRKKKNSKLWRNVFTFVILISLITGVVFTILEAI